MNTTHTITNQVDLRASFWESHPQFIRRGRQSQNKYPCDIRVSFVDFVDNMKRDGQISEALGRRATLG